MPDVLKTYGLDNQLSLLDALYFIENLWLSPLILARQLGGLAYIDIMENKEMKQSRIDELKGKIDFARDACNSYKGKNNYLYQVNSFYLDELKKELERLKKVVAMRC